MTRPCRVCLSSVGDCKRCLRALFARDDAPIIELELARLHTLALGTVGYTSLSGVQRKISADFRGPRATLQVAVDGARFILKPQTETFPQLPENEHVTMRLADAFGLDVPPCGLFPLEDGTSAYVVRRFDRLDGGGKLAAEDFCQLTEQAPKEKYSGSAERCAKIVQRLCDEPGIEVLKLFRLFVFSWWVGNGDLHLKNIALIRDRDGRIRLSPSYDLVSTRLLIPDDAFALTVAGKRKNLDGKSFLTFAATAGIPEKAARRVLAQPASCLARARELIAASSLTDDRKSAYVAQLESGAEP